MSGFSAPWLALRAPHDLAARSRALAEAFLVAVPAGGRIVDLGAGTGTNVAALRALDRAAHLWRAVDADPALLAVAQTRFDGAVETRALDLAADLDGALEGAAGVTASALLDLASAAWIERLADALASRRAPALFALSYDGRMAWTPPHPDDARVALGFHRHMRRDKGFGPALGPGAVEAAAAALARRGARIARAASDWIIASDAGAMLAAMIDGVARPALEASPEDAVRIAGWVASRHAALGAGALGLVVGHFDLYARFA